MIVNLGEIEEGSSERELTCEPSSLEFPEEAPAFVAPIEVHLKLVRKGGDIFLKGEISFSVELLCARCAGSFRKPFSEVVEAVYKKEQPGAEAGEVQLTEEETMIVFYDGETIDLAIPIRDTVLLAIPMKPLCKDSCKGLCPRCGKDLNEGPCGCVEKEIDPRWQGLAELKNG